MLCENVFNKRVWFFDVKFNKKKNVFKQIHSDDNLSKDVRNSIAFHYKILPFLLEHPTTKFIIQHAKACWITQNKPV